MSIKNIINKIKKERLIKRVQANHNIRIIDLLKDEDVVKLQNCGRIFFVGTKGKGKSFLKEYEK